MMTALQQGRAGPRCIWVTPVVVKSAIQAAHKRKSRLIFIAASASPTAKGFDQVGNTEVSYKSISDIGALGIIDHANKNKRKPNVVIVYSRRPRSQGFCWSGRPKVQTLDPKATVVGATYRLPCLLRIKQGAASFSYIQTHPRRNTS